VPSLKGLAWKDARAALKKLGLGIRFSYEEQSPDTYGTVVFQAPAAGSYLPKGSSAVVVLAD
jgi:beta-lactam-binding protein with PASTA domain